MVHIWIKFEEPATNQQEQRSYFTSLSTPTNTLRRWETQTKNTSKNTKNGAIRKACARLSNKAGARFYWKMQIKLRFKNRRNQFVKMSDLSNLKHSMAYKLVCPTEQLSSQYHLIYNKKWIRLAYAVWSITNVLKLFSNSQGLNGLEILVRLRICHK